MPVLSPLVVLAGVLAGVLGGSWVAPLPEPVSVVRGFAPPAQVWEPGHRGVDLAGRTGQPVLAAGAGVVGYAGLLAGVPVVTVVHGELRTTYQPVRAAVRAGQRVAAGQRIGTLAAAGGHCRPAACLHWGLLRGATYLDPMSLLERGPPRLLPLAGPLGPSLLTGALRVFAW